MPRRRHDETTFDSGLDVVVDSLDVKQEERIETMAGPFKWDLMDAAKGIGFFILHQPNPEDARDHHCTQAMDETGHDRKSCLLGQLWFRSWCDLDRNCARARDAGRRVEDGSEETPASEDGRIKIMRVWNEQRRDGRPHPVVSEMPVENENPRQGTRLPRETITEDGSNCRPGNSVAPVGKKVQRK